jgi:glycosyltransferase involved in cell wall biosynthesis
MAQTEGISILISVYNGAKFLDELLISILSQMSDKDELLIYDDESTDNSIEILNKYCKTIYQDFQSFSPIQLEFNGIQERITYNYLSLILLSNKKTVVLVDQDDIWLPNKLEIIRKFSEFDLLVHDAIVVNTDRQLIHPSYINTIGNFSKSLLKNVYKNRFLGCCMAFKRETIFPFIPKTIKQYYYHDQIIGLALLKKNVKFHYPPLIEYRRHPNNVTTTVKKSNRSIKTIIAHRLFLLTMIAKFKLIEYSLFYKNITNKNK